MNQRRMLHSVLWEDEDYAQLSDGAKLLFIGMFSHADDDGRIKANPRFLKSAVFMYDDTKSAELIESFRQEISTHMKSLVFYTVDGKQYAQFTKWEQYQSIRGDRKKPSTLPSVSEQDELSPQVDNQVTTNPQPNVRIEEGNRSEVKRIIPVAKAPGIQKSQNPGKETEVQRVVAYLDQATGAKTTNFGKQSKFWKAMHDAGYSEKQIRFAIDDMWETEFWKEHGFDLKNVADQISKIKQKYSRET